MNEQLKQFLTEWHDWATTAGCGQQFDKMAGLCLSWDRWVRKNDPRYWSIRPAHMGELTALFVADGLNAKYPFGGGDVFYDDFHTASMHKNPKRLAWVKGKINA